MATPAELEDAEDNAAALASKARDAAGQTTVDYDERAINQAAAFQHQSCRPGRWQSREHPLSESTGSSRLRGWTVDERRRRLIRVDQGQTGPERSQLLPVLAAGGRPAMSHSE